MEQQAILDTTTGDADVVNINIIEQSSVFSLNGQLYQLGRPGDRFRTVIHGKTNAAAPPAFFIAGYAVGAGRDDE
jgi:hypothetical protein